MAYPTDMDEMGVIIPHGWGRTWPDALRRAGSSPAVVSFFGASTTEGYFTTNHFRRGWVGRVVAKAQAEYGHGGDGFLSTTQAPVGSAAPSDLISQGAWLHDDESAMCGLIFTFEGGAWVEWPNFNGDEIYVLYNPLYSSGYFEVWVDGVLAERVNGWTGGMRDAAPQSHKVKGSFGAGPHNVRIVNAGDSPGQFLIGLYAGNSTGVRSLRVAHTGWTTVNMTNPAWNGAPNPPDDVALWACEKLPELINSGPNDLIVFVLGTNDWILGVPQATTLANTRKILTHCRNNRDNVDILFLINHPGTLGNAGYTSFIEAMYEVAAEFDAATVDLWAKSGFSTDMGSLLDDGLHPTDHGMEWYAESVSAVVSGLCVGSDSWTRSPQKPKSPVGSWLEVPAGASNYAYTDSLAGFDWEDLEVVFYARTADWSPSGGADVVAVWDGAGARSWAMGFNASGQSRLNVSANGTDPFSAVSDNPTVVASDGAGATARVVRTVNDANNVTFWDAPQWRQNGDAKPLLSGSKPFSAPGSGRLRVGASGGGSFTGQVWTVEVWNNGVLVANPDFTRLKAGTVSFRDGCGNLWELAGSASYGYSAFSV